MGGTFFKALLGALAGLVAWLIWEPQFPKVLMDPSWSAIELRFVLTLGALVGTAIGGVNGWLQGSKRHTLRGLGVGLILGGVGSWIGYRLGGGLLAALFPPDIFLGSHGIAEQTVARIVAITPLGLFVGLAIGIGGLTTRRVLVGALGGLLGGFAAGAAFDTISALMSPIVLDLRGGFQSVRDGIPRIEGETGIVGRAVTGLAIGFFVGLFVGIVDRITRTAWIRLVLGRNEGREWVVDSPQTFIGRSESAHVPLFGDPNVAPMHACIARHGQAYILMDGGSPIGTYLNGQRVAQAPLFHGAQIQIGPHLLVFSLRQGSALQTTQERLRSYSYSGQASVSQPAPQGYGLQSTAASPIGSPLGVPAPGFPHPPASSQPTQKVQRTAPTSGSFALVALDGPLAGQRFPVTGPFEIGRETAGIPLGFDASASRRHARIAPDVAGLSVADLGSTNGTFVNGQRVPSAILRPGDHLKIGATTFRVESA